MDQLYFIQVSQILKHYFDFCSNARTIGRATGPPSGQTITVPQLDFRRLQCRKDKLC